MNYQDELAALRTTFQKKTNTIYLPAVLGDALGNVVDPNRPGYVWIREQTSNGLSQPRRVLWPAYLRIPQLPGTPVTLGYNEQGNEIVKNADTFGVLAANVNTVTTSQATDSSRTQQMNIQTLALIPQNPPSMYVGVRAWNPIVGTVAYQFPGTIVNLSSYVPSVGQMRYATVFVKNDYSTVEVKTSTARGVTDIPLGLTDVQETLNAKSSGSTPVFSVKLIGGQTVVTQDDINNDGVPLQQLVNTAESGGSGSVTSVALSMPAEFSVSGSPVTSAGTLTVTKATESANSVFAGPTSGGAAAPTFRSLVANDYVTMVGDSGSGGTKGAVPAPAAGDAAAGKFLKADGTWTTPSAGSGSVTSVALSMPAEFSVSGSPITTNGTLTVTKANESANTVFAGPTSGGAAAPTFRSLVANDYVTMVGDSGSGGTKGAVPAPSSGDAAAGKFLKADGTWTTPPAGGGGSSITTTTDTLLTRKVLYDNTLSGAGSWDVSSIDQTYTNLRIIIIARSAWLPGGSGGTDFGLMEFNADTTAANYDYADDFGSSATGSAWVNNRRAGLFPTNDAMASAFGLYEAVIPDYAETTRYKTVTGINNAHYINSSGGGYAVNDAMIWRNTNAINRITVKSGNGTSGNWATGSRLIIIGEKTQSIVTGVTGAGTVQATTYGNGTVANTASETTLVGSVSGSMTLSANALGAGRTLRIQAWGIVSDTGTPTLQIKVKLGSTIILDSGTITLGAGISNKLWKLEGLITCRTTGASGTVYGQGEFRQNGTTTDIVNTTTSTIDTTASQVIGVTATWGTGSASNTISCTNMIVEILN